MSTLNVVLYIYDNLTVESIHILVLSFAPLRTRFDSIGGYVVYLSKGVLNRTDICQL